ncbi:homoserine kinase [Hymenobacter sp. HDW8]|uniref:homoserine kinase n=1 Tax=Hymenobacter sp. HDW8 TaxID=2714932 RepID=UPI00140851E1|nr:homoserine kinase [Hymenobacter sp. HDW8]QIL76579.1 homoserine kinase [Hymenobacter sp. HDW8]
MPSSDFLTLYSPATVANMVCGFDILGFALEAPYDTMHMRLTDQPGVVITHEDDFQLPTDPARNVAGAALLALLKAAPAGTGFEVRINKAILPGSGIGSSAASAAGAVVGANKLLGGIFSQQELVRFAMFGEEVASGAQHADNIAPAIYGGVTLIRAMEPLDVVPLSAPPLHVTVVHPQIEVRTADARQMLKQQVSLKSAIHQWANVAGLVAGLLKADYQLIGRSLEDVIVEPVRSILIPGFAAVKSCSLEAGALGGGISGSGPSIFMLSEDEATAQAVASAMRVVYEKLSVDFHIHVSTINSAGVRFKQ